MNPSFVFLYRVTFDRDGTEIKLKPLLWLHQIWHNNQWTVQIQVKFGTEWLLF